MLISHRKKFIYTKTAKTAGTSVESYFEKYCMPEGDWQFSHKRDQYIARSGIIGYRGANTGDNDWFNHMSATEIKSKIGEDCWDKYFKFCVVRNPFDKLVSLFFFSEARNNSGHKKETDTIQSFREWISKGVPIPDRQQYLHKGEVCMDYFIRYENLANGIKHVCDHLDLPFEPQNIATLKSGIRDRSIKTQDFYSNEIVQMVYMAYEFEFKEFGYSFPA